MKLSVVHKFSLTLMLMVLISVGVIGGLFYVKTSNVLVNNALSGISEKIQDEGAHLQSHIERQYEDLIFLANVSPIQGILRARNNGGFDNGHNVDEVYWLHELQEIFIAQLISKPSYFSARYIDVNGYEIVHVGREAGQPVVFELQDKSHRNYVRETLKLPQGSIYLSEINLNREFGRVVEPHQEVLRSAMPIYDEQTGALAGMVALTVEIGHELRYIQSKIQGNSRDIYMTNDHGGFLLHPDSSKTYGFDLGKQYSLQEEMPSTARLFLPGNSEKSLTLFPEQTGGKLVAVFSKMTFDTAKPERFIAVGISHPYRAVVAENTAVLNEMLGWGFFLTIAAALLGFSISMRLSRPIKQITRAVDDFTHQRSSNAILPIAQNDEIGVLARAFKSMTQQVEESRSNLVHLNENLESMVAERAALLEKSEMRQSAVLKTIADAVITIDKNGLIESFNPAAETIFGYQESEVVGKDVSLLLPESERAEHKSYTRNSTLSSSRVINQRRDLIGKRKDGRLFPLDLNVSAIKHETGRGFVGILRDITDRKKAEQEVNRLKSTLDESLDCVFMFEPDSLKFFYVNKGAVEQVGYSYDELMTMRPYDIKPDIDENQFRSLIEPLLSGERQTINFETTHQHKNGSQIPVEISLQYVTPENEMPRFVAFVRDITERQRMDKMKNEFISTVSHELRTPLTSIRGSLGLLSGGAMGELSAPVQDMLKIAGNNTERLLLLINDILDIQKIESGQMAFKFQRVELKSFLEQSVNENSAYGEQFGVEFFINNVVDDARVFADKDRLMQVMANLLSNAAKFSPQGGTVEINVALHHQDYFRISVTDHGAGIPEEFYAKIFEKFTQSDSSDTRIKGGTGLGLSISKIIVEKHGGRIDFVSHEGIGTTFYIELPCMTKTVLLEDDDHPRQLSQIHSASILIVENDPDVAALMQRMLAEAGCNSDIAYDVEQAREMLLLHPGQYRAITLDLKLPGEGGVGFLKTLRHDAATENIPVVVVSVEPDKAKKQLNGGAMGVVDWLAKPIDQQRLIDSVRQAAGPNEPPRVLHVEDEVDVHTVVKAMLQDYCELTWTASLAASEEALNNYEFNLVLLDIGLPDGSGLDLLETIERRVKPPRVVIFSAYDVTEEYADKVSAVLVKSKTDSRKLADVILSVMRAD